MEFIPGWTITATLGEGAFGEVKLLHNPATSESVALKLLHLKSTVDHEETELLIKKEISIHGRLKHENIVKFFGARMEDNVWFLFLEYCDGGELYDRIDPDVGLVPHTSTASFFSQIIAGATHLHSLGICHRDLKPENILLSRDTIKISDFGLSTLYKNEDGAERLLDTKCGTPPYLAPEVLASCTNGRSYKAMPIDVWSCGIILVALLGGELPWDRADPMTSTEYKLWRESTPANTSPWNKFDLATLSFCKRLLCPLPSKRITFEQISDHPWMKKRNRKKDPLATTIIHPHKEGMATRLHNPVETSALSQLCCLSQPDFILNYTNSESCNGLLQMNDKFSFSQPAHAQLLPDETTATTTPLSKRLVNRMTRIFVKSNSKECLNIVTNVLDGFCYQWKVFQEGKSVHVITISTVDKRKSPLVFKCTLLEIQDDTVLLDFRLSRGDGLEFKRHFLRLKQELRDYELQIGASLFNLF